VRVSARNGEGVRRGFERGSGREVGRELERGVWVLAERGEFAR